MIEKHSTTGVRHNLKTHESEEYEHITVRPCTDSISSCNACGRANYERNVKDKVEPSGLQLVELVINSNGWQGSVTILCPDCIKDLRTKLFPHSA